MSEYDFVSNKMCSKYLRIYKMFKIWLLFTNITEFMTTNLNILLYAECWNQKYFPEM